MTTPRSRAPTRASAPSTSRLPPKTAARWVAAGASRTGARRSKNEDGWLVVPAEGLRPLLVAVADGVGGEVGGDRASAAALASLAAAWRTWQPSGDPSADDVARRLQAAGTAADEAVRALGERDETLRRAATTMTAAALAPAPDGAADAHLLHAGDSRAYRIDGNGTVDRLTDDHTWAENELRSGGISVAEAARHPMRHVIVEFLGRPDGCTFDSALFRLEADQGVLLCTDGVSGLTTPEQLRELSRQGRQALVLPGGAPLADRVVGEPEPQALVAALMAHVTACDGGDDATAVVTFPMSAGDPYGLRGAEAPSRAARAATAARRPALICGGLVAGAAAVVAAGVWVSRLLDGASRTVPESDARRYLERLQAGDYAALYSTISRRARAAIDQASFVQRHEAVAAEMTLSRLELRLVEDASPGASAASDAVRLPFEALYRTARFGELRRRNDLPLVWEEARWAVYWTPAVLLPELGGGRLVRAVSDPAVRGSILDRGGRALAATAGGVGRTYPAGEVAGPLTGYVGQVSGDELKELAPRGYLAGDTVGRAGIEAASEALLAGQRGGRLTIIQPNGDLAETLATVPPRAGESVVLTLDADIQRDVEAALGDRRGSAIVADARTGAIRALASVPRYDPNAFTRGGNPAAILNDPGQPLIVRPLQGLYPAGSTFKVVTMAAALESGAFAPTSEFTCTGRWSGLPGLGFDCWLRTGHGRLNLVDGLTHSCNSVFYEIGKRLDEIDSEILPGTAAQCGIGAQVGVAGGLEAAGVAPSPAWKQRTLRDGWARGDAVNMAIGQGQLLVTPVQLTAIYQAIATSGQGPGLRLLDRSLLPGGSVERPLASAAPKLRWSAPTLDAIRTGLRGVIGSPGGTAAFVFQGSPLAALAAGKTGTAESGPGRTSHAWFACYAPFDAPRAVVLVMLENAGEGSSAAAPVARRILELVLDRL